MKILAVLFVLSFGAVAQAACPALVDAPDTLNFSELGKGSTLSFDYLSSPDRKSDIVTFQDGKLVVGGEEDHKRPNCRASITDSTRSVLTVLDSFVYTATKHVYAYQGNLSQWFECSQSRDDGMEDTTVAGAKEALGPRTRVLITRAQAKKLGLCQ